MKKHQPTPRLIQHRPIAIAVYRAFGGNPMAMLVFLSEDTGKPFVRMPMHSAIQTLQSLVRRYG
jgi:hypothetical protein